MINEFQFSRQKWNTLRHLFLSDHISFFISNGKIIQYVFLLTVVGSRTGLLNLFYEKLDWFTLLEENKKLNSWKTKTNDNDTARQAKRLTLSLQSGVSQSNKYNFLKIMKTFIVIQKSTLIFQNIHFPLQIFEQFSDWCCHFPVPGLLLSMKFNI